MVVEVRDRRRDALWTPVRTGRMMLLPTWTPQGNTAHAGGPGTPDPGVTVSLRTVRAGGHGWGGLPADRSLTNSVTTFQRHCIPRVDDLAVALLAIPSTGATVIRGEPGARPGSADPRRRSRHP